VDEPRPFYHELRTGFLTGIGAILAGGAVAALLWIAKHIGLLPIQAIQWAWHLIPTGKSVWTISLCLFASGAILLAISFFVIFLSAFKFIKAREARWRDLESGKIGVGDLTIGELAIFRDRLEKIRNRS
jgi:hypothetical protein